MVNKHKNGYDILKAKYDALQTKYAELESKYNEDAHVITAQLDSLDEMENQRDNARDALETQITLVQQLEIERDQLESSMKFYKDMCLEWDKEDIRKLIWIYKHVPFARIIVKLFYKEK